MASRIQKLPPEQQAIAARLALTAYGPNAAARERALHFDPPKLALRQFTADAWHVLEPMTRFVSGWHIDAVCDHCEAVTAGHIRNLIINIPPRHMKSLIVSVIWPVWEWTFAPWIRFLTSSYVQRLATRDALKSRRLIMSPWFQERWGGVFKLSGDQNLKSRYDNSRTGYRITTSVAGSGTGEGGDRILVDDPHNVKEKESDVKREAVLTWWDETMSTRGNDPMTVARVIIMQRVHEADLTGHVLEQGGYEHLKIPAEYTGSKYHTAIGWCDPRTKQGELIWPERFPLEAVQELKLRLGSYQSAAQLQQEPAPAGGGMIKSEWFRFYTYPGVHPPVGDKRPRYPLPPKFDEQLQSWDMNFKEMKDNDLVAGHAWARKGPDCYLIDRTKEHYNFPQTLRAVRELTRRNPGAVLKLVENKANGPAVVQMLRTEIPGFVEVNPEGGKEARVAAVSPVIESGNVYLPAPEIAPWVVDFILECARFPRGEHDDDVDAMTQALVRMMPMIVMMRSGTRQFFPTIKG